MELSNIVDGLPPGWFSEYDCEELARLAARVPENGIIVEVGSFLGRSSMVLARSSPKAKQIVCIDPWPMPYPVPAESTASMAGYVKGETDTLFPNIMEAFKKFLKPYPNVRMIRGASPLQWWHEYDGKVDLVFLDGMHKEPWLTQDVEFAERLLKDGGTIAGHDYLPQHWPDVAACADRVSKRYDMPLTVGRGSIVWSVGPIPKINRTKNEQSA